MIKNYILLITIKYLFKKFIEKKKYIEDGCKYYDIKLLK